MSVIRNIKVNAGKPYNVTVGKGLLPRVGSLLSQRVAPCHAAVITDSNVAPLYLAQTEESLRSAGYKVCSYVFPAGEKNKNLVTFIVTLYFFKSFFFFTIIFNYNFLPIIFIFICYNLFKIE